MIAEHRHALRFTEFLALALGETDDVDEALQAATLALEQIALANNPWVQYQGTGGGRGWKHSQTGEVRYQQAQPAPQEGGAVPQPQEQQRIGLPFPVPYKTKISDAVQSITQKATALVKEAGGDAIRLGNAREKASLALEKAVGGRAAKLLEGFQSHYGYNELRKLPEYRRFYETIRELKFSAWSFGRHLGDAKEGEAKQDLDAKLLSFQAAVVGLDRAGKNLKPGAPLALETMVVLECGSDVLLAQGQNLYHGPNPPGPGWQQVGTGPNQGRIWKYTGGSAAAAPPAPAAPKSTVAPAQSRQSPTQPAAALPQPSDTGKDFMQGISQNLATQTHLRDTHKRQYTAAMNHVVSRMPDSAIDTASRNLDKVDWYADHQSLTADMARADSHLAEVAKKGGLVAGAYGTDRILSLDGGRTYSRERGEGFIPQERSNAHETYAHEMAHAVDGPSFLYSRHKLWEQAWKEEIDQRENPLSQYAREDAQEGFAEFGRLVYGTDADRAQIEATFPKASEFWKRAGLWRS